MTFRASVERYLGAVAQQHHRGDAREESYYDVLKQLWEELGSQLSSAHATLTVLPRQTEAGNPDMRVWSGQQHVTGYIEAKEPGVTNLTVISHPDGIPAPRDTPEPSKRA